MMLPGAAAVMALAILAPWLGKNPHALFFVTPLVLFFGVLALAAGSFGREINMGTFSSLLAQPVERRRIWRAKFAPLGIVTVLIFAAYCASWLVRMHTGWINPGNFGAIFLKGSFATAAGIGALFALMALSGGLWTTLLLRHTIAAFWVAFLIPAGALIVELLVDARLVRILSALADPGDNKAGLEHARAIIYCGMVVLGVAYSIAGIIFSRRLFLRAQDVAGFGNAFSVFSGRSPEAARKSSDGIRRRRPARALLRKEIRLHAIGILFAGVMLPLHFCAILLRTNTQALRGFPMLEAMAQCFWAFWLIAPLIIGCMVVAEERKFGVMEGQFCLPVPRLKQFLLKILPAVFFGIVIGSVLPLGLEIAAHWIREPGEFLNISSAELQVILKIIAGAAGLVLVGIWGSTLARNFLQAMSIAIAGAGACLVIGALVTGKRLIGLFGLGLPVLATLAVCLTLPWLAWRNYKFFAESERVWRRNALTLAGVLLFMFAGSFAIYHRAWEFFQPAEPAHGTPRLSLANPPKLRGDGWGGLQVHLPDGRVWVDAIGEIRSYDIRERDKPWRKLFRPLPASMGPGMFLPESNWVSVTTGFQFHTGIKDDGTLWFLAKTTPGAWGMKRAGAESDWRQVASIGSTSIPLLLKKDGTLWQWHDNASVQAHEDSDWQEIFSARIARKTDGSIWTREDEHSDQTIRFIRARKLEQFTPESSASSDTWGWQGHLVRDGSLWMGPSDRMGDDSFRNLDYQQVGVETNWTSVITTSSSMVALKADGTLWQWSLPSRNKTLKDAAAAPPTRLGKHNDWVGVTCVSGRIVSLAADGSLWQWPHPYYDRGPFTKNAPKQPKQLANIFDSEN